MILRHINGLKGKPKYNIRMLIKCHTYQPAQAKNNLAPNSGLFVQKLYRMLYMITVGSATPTINRGWPPNIEWIIPQIAVDANVSTVLRLPSAKKTWHG